MQEKIKDTQRLARALYELAREAYTYGDLNSARDYQARAAQARLALIRTGVAA